VRAALEGVAFQSKELLQAMTKDVRHVMSRHTARTHELKVDGGMTANSLLMQFQADITGRKVVRPVVAETTALGAAYAAGLAVGYWKDLTQLRSQWQVSAVWEPRMPAAEVRALQWHWTRAVTRSLGWAQPYVASADAGAEGGEAA
jgi:glycerol kinase